KADDHLYVIPRNGTTLGNFFGASGPPQFPRGGDIAVCDLNHDGFDDIVVAPSFEIFTDPSVTFGAFFPTPRPSFTLGVDKLACADLNNDGFADLIVAHAPPSGPPFTGSFEIFTDPSRPPVTFFSTPPRFQADDAIAAGDVDGDGFAEVAIGHVDIAGG